MAGEPRRGVAPAGSVLVATAVRTLHVNEHYEIDPLASTEN